MRLHVVVTALSVAACSAPKEAGTAPFATPATTIAATGTGPTPTGAPASAGGDASASVKPVKDVDVFAKVGGDLTACYEDGKKAVPTMTSGRVTFHVAVDASGKTACVVPSDDTGLTQDVMNCMRMRLETETYDERDAPWSFSVPLAVKDGTLGLGAARATPPSIETVESHGLAEDVYEVIDALLPDLYGCVKELPRSGDMRVVYVGARVGSGGTVACALASAPISIPVETRACTAKVLGRAKFRPPKKGHGLVSVPLIVMSRK